MKNAAHEDTLTQAAISTLNQEYKNFVERLRRRWLRDNNRRPKEWRLYEIDAEERQRVDRVILGWEHYMTPIAERWWKRRGFGIRWPEKSSDPCQIYKLETAAA